MIRRRRERRRKIVLGSLLGVIILILVGFLVLLLVDGPSGAAALEELAQAESATTEEAREIHPWDNKESVAIAAAKQHQVAGAGRVDAEVTSSGLNELSVFNGFDEDDFEWHARWVTDRSLYWVSYAIEKQGVRVGPTWLVQLDPEGPRPDGNSDGVVPANTLAEYVEMPSDRSDIQRYVRRTGHVLRELTEYKGDDGLQLASSLLIYFLGRGFVAENTEVLGWTIVPTRIESDGDALYDAYFQWVEDDEPRVAQWQINVKTGQIRPQNLLATQIVASAKELDPDDIIDIRPRQLDLDTPPARERNTMVRALRYVLADARRIEAVGALLAAQSRNDEISYDGWRIEPDGCRECTVKYQYSQGEEHSAVSWSVSARGDVQPQGEIAIMADRALRLEASVARTTDADESDAEGSGGDADEATEATE